MRRVTRLSFALLWFGIMTGPGRLRAADAPVLKLPPCFSDHTVLQQRELDRRDNTPVLWGWCTKGADVRVRFFGQPKPVDAIVEYHAPEGGGDLRRWRLPAGDLRAPLQPMTGGEIRIEATLKKVTTEVVLKDVAVGDVWVMGVEPGVQLAAPAGTALADGGSVRWLAVDGMGWTNWGVGGTSGGLTVGWKATEADMPAPARLLARALAANPGVPVGLVLVNRARLNGLVSNQNVGAGRSWGASMRRLQAVLPPVNQQLQESFSGVSESQAREIRQARRRGEVWVPPDGQPEAAVLIQWKRFFEGSLPAMGYSVAGFSW